MTEARDLFLFFMLETFGYVFYGDFALFMNFRVQIMRVTLLFTYMLTFLKTILANLLALRFIATTFVLYLM